MKQTKKTKILVGIMSAVAVALIIVIAVLLIKKNPGDNSSVTGGNNNPVAAIFNKDTNNKETQSQTENDTTKESSETPTQTSPESTQDTNPDTQPPETTQPNTTEPETTPATEPEKTPSTDDAGKDEPYPDYGTVVIGYSMSDQPRSYNNYMGWKLVVQTYVYSDKDGGWSEAGFTPYSLQAWELREILKLGRPQAMPNNPGFDGDQMDVYIWVWLD